MDYDEITPSTKFLLMPRFATIWDLKKLLSRKIKIQPLIDFELDDSNTLEEHILYRVAELAKVEEMKYYIPKENILFWSENFKRIIKLLLKESKEDYAVYVLIEWLSIAFMIISIFFRDNLKSALSIDFESPFIISKEDISVLIDSILDRDFINKLSESGLKEILDAFIYAYCEHYAAIRRVSKEDEIKKIDDIYLRLYEYKKSLNISEITKNKKACLVFTSLSYIIINSITQARIWGKSNFHPNISETNIRDLIKLILQTYEQANHYTDLAQKILYNTAKVVLLLDENDIDKAVSIFREIGSLIFKAKLDLSLFGVSERIFVKLPIETAALDIPPIHILLNLADELSDVGLVLVPNDLYKTTVNTLFEVRLILQNTFIREPEVFTEFLRKSMKDTIASIAVYTIFGAPLSRLFDAMGIFIRKDKFIRKGLLHLKLLNEILDELFEETLSLIKEGYPLSLKRVILFPLYREVFYISNKLTPKIKMILEEHEVGRSFLQRIEKIFNTIDKIIGKKETKKKEEIEDISDLYI